MPKPRRKLPSIRQRIMAAFVLFGLLVAVVSMLSMAVVQSTDEGLLAIALIVALIVLGGWQVATYATHDIRKLATVVAEHTADVMEGRMPKCEIVSQTLESRELCNAFLKFADRLAELTDDLQEQIVTCETKVETSARNLHNFMFRIAHTLRTPMNEIRWSAETLKNEQVGRLTTGQREILDSLERSSVDLLNRTGVLQDTLAVLRGEKLRMKPQSGDLIPLIDETLGKWAVPARRRKIELVWHRPATALPDVHYDKNRLLQVLDALVSNAILYTKPKKKVEVSVECADDAVLVSVRDHGIGIPDGDQKSMFEPFYRASNASDLWVDGTGVSLTLARAIVKSLGGQMSFTSKKGKGTVMKFSLPVA